MEEEEDDEEIESIERSTQETGNNTAIKNKRKYDIHVTREDVLDELINQYVKETRAIEDYEKMRNLKTKLNEVNELGKTWVGTLKLIQKEED